ncbi:MAG: imipenem/basic amino acid-specific outer membrane pore [Sulfurimonas sp.]|jgi:imipenem/basic amino acid-specific outer membrane pore
MKIFKLSLVAMLAIGTASFAADNLADAFSNGKVKGEIKFMYVNGSDSDVGANIITDDKNTAAVAMELNYITDNYKGFKLGVSYQGGSDLSVHDKDDGSEDDPRLSITDVGMHEAFLQYSIMKSTIKVGRQIMRSPMILNSSRFPMKDSMDGATIVSKLIPKTLVKLFYIKEWNKRYGNAGNSAKATQQDFRFDDPLTSIYINNRSIKNLTLDGQYMTTNQEGVVGDLPVVIVDGYDQYFARASYKLPITLPLSLGAIYGGASFNNSMYSDASFYGATIGTKLKKVKLDLAYTSVNDDMDFPGTIGQVPDTLLYTNMLINQSIYAGVSAVSLKANYNFDIKGLTSSVKYGYLDQSEEGMKNTKFANSKTHVKFPIGTVNEINLDMKYKFSGELKGLSTKLAAGYASSDIDVDENTNTYFQYSINYNF